MNRLLITTGIITIVSIPLGYIKINIYYLELLNFIINFTIVVLINIIIPAIRSKEESIYSSIDKSLDSISCFGHSMTNIFSFFNFNEIHFWSRGGLFKRLFPIILTLILLALLLYFILFKFSLLIILILSILLGLLLVLLTFLFLKRLSGLPRLPKKSPLPNVEQNNPERKTDNKNTRKVEDL